MNADTVHLKNAERLYSDIKAIDIASSLILWVSVVFIIQNIHFLYQHRDTLKIDAYLKYLLPMGAGVLALNILIAWNLIGRGRLEYFAMGSAGIALLLYQVVVFVRYRYRLHLEELVSDILYWGLRLSVLGSLFISLIKVSISDRRDLARFYPHRRAEVIRMVFTGLPFTLKAAGVRRARVLIASLLSSTLGFVAILLLVSDPFLARRSALKQEVEVMQECTQKAPLGDGQTAEQIVGRLSQCLRSGARESFILYTLLPIGGMFLAVAGAVAFRRLRRRLNLQSLTDLVSVDNRPRVTFLRPFLAEHAVVPVVEKHLLIRLFDYPPASVKFEQIVLERCSIVGPVVAIGNPRDERQPSGVARAYVENDEWQGEVTRQLDKSCLAVVIAGGSGGVLWELEEAIVRRDRVAVLILFPSVGSAAGWRDFGQMEGFLREVGVIGGNLPPNVIAVGATRGITKVYVGNHRTAASYNLAVDHFMYFLQKRTD